MPLVSNLVSPGREVLVLALGALAGICLFCRGLILLLRNPVPHRAAPFGGENIELREPAASPEIIRLSPAVATSSSIEMTSQARIAAALSRAGMAGPAAWTASQSSVEAAGALAAPRTHSHAADPHEIGPFAWKVGVMICGGPALTITCLYLLAVEAGWL